MLLKPGSHIVATVVEKLWSRLLRLLRLLRLTSSHLVVAVVTTVVGKLDNDRGGFVLVARSRNSRDKTGSHLVFSRRSRNSRGTSSRNSRRIRTVSNSTTVATRSRRSRNSRD